LFHAGSCLIHVIHLSLIRSDHLPLIAAFVRTSAGQLGAEHVDAFDRRRLRQQPRGVRAQRLRDRPVEVGLTTGLVSERIEDAEGVGRKGVYWLRLPNETP
jgi:hypothetical protein